MMKQILVLFFILFLIDLLLLLLLLLLLEIDPTSELSADFQNLFSALNADKIVESSADENISHDLIQAPTGASQERVSGILRWVLDPLMEYYQNHLSTLPIFNELQKSPLLHSRQSSRNENDRPTSATPIPAPRRSSVSEMIWTNQFVDMAPKPTDENGSISSDQSFVSTGLEKSEVIREMTIEELDDKNMEKIRQSARMAGIGMLNFFFFFFFFTLFYFRGK